MSACQALQQAAAPLVNCRPPHLSTNTPGRPLSSNHTYSITSGVGLGEEISSFSSERKLSARGLRGKHSGRSLHRRRPT